MARGSTYTEEQLRAEFEAGHSQKEIAEKFGVTVSAICRRAKALRITTQTAAVDRRESVRYVHGTLDAMEQLTRALSRVNLLMDACDEWLRDAKDPQRYDVGPREGEVQVTYMVEKSSEDGKRLWTEKRKESLSHILAELETVDGERVCAVEKWESKHADPRTLILQTAQEVRQTVQTAATLARMLADARAMQQFREALLYEIRRVDPDVAQRIAEAVQRSILLAGAAEAFNTLSASSGGEPALPEVPG